MTPAQQSVLKAMQRTIPGYHQPQPQKQMGKVIPFRKPR